METPQNEELITAFKEIFDMTRKALDALETDIESEDEETKNYALHISGLLCIALLNLEKVQKNAH